MSAPGTSLEVPIQRSGRNYNTAFAVGMDWKQENTQSLAELLAGFFAFYGRDFDWGTHMVPAGAA